MIKYQLSCDAGHEFEAWFASIGAFDQQAADGLITCPHCPSHAIAKRPMAPAIVSHRRCTASDRQPETPATAAPEAISCNSTHQDALAALRAIKAEILAGSENVGAQFAEEARRIHFGETEPRAIHGEATLSEQHALYDEGIAFGLLPRLPDEQN